MKQIIISLFICISIYSQVRVTDIVEARIANPEGDTIYHIIWGEGGAGEYLEEYVPFGTICFITGSCKLQWIEKIGDNVLVKTIPDIYDFQGVWQSSWTGNYYKVKDSGTLLLIQKSQWDEMKVASDKEMLRLRRQQIKDSSAVIEQIKLKKQILKILEHK